MSPITLPWKLWHHVRIRGGAKIRNGAWDMMTMAAYVICAQWIAIAVLAMVSVEAFIGAVICR